MPWNWELSKWPCFSYDPSTVKEREKEFFFSMGKAHAAIKAIDLESYKLFIVDILTSEGIESSKIEGELLNRESLQSSLKRHFGLATSSRKETPKESCMAKVLCHIYETFHQPLTHEMLYLWHAMLFDKDSAVSDVGRYRTHKEPMQIVSHRYGDPRVFFEAPPSQQVFHEMNTFIEWFNKDDAKESILAKAAIAHVYFESIHPFEDGNGRIGRLLVEKMLSQTIKKPLLLAISRVLEKRKKNYYAALEKCNTTLQIDDWIDFFSEMILLAQQETINLLYFLIEKSKLLSSLSGKINERQEKVLLRMFAEGPSGFKGGLNAEKYVTITKTSRATATRDLADLVEKNALYKTGERRHTRYWLNLSQKEFY